MAMKPRKKTGVKKMRGGGSTSANPHKARRGM